MSSAILHFINSYLKGEGNGHTVQSSSDLQDGKILYTIFCRGIIIEEEEPTNTKDFFTFITKHLPNSIDAHLVPTSFDTSENLIQLATAILVFLVQSEEGKEECVNNIMGLSEQDQEELMHIIERNINTTPDSPNSPFTSSPQSANKLHHLQTTAERLRRRSSLGNCSNNTPGSHSSHSSQFSQSSQFSKSSFDISSKRLARENHILKEEVEWFTRELEKQKAAAAAADEKYRLEITKFRDQQTRSALHVAEEEEALRTSFETSIREKDLQLQTLQAKVEENDASSKQVTKLKDELAILKENLKDKTKLEDTLNRYREKHAQVGDLNAQVIALEEKTRTLLARATKAEDKAATIPDLKQKLEQYKVAVAAAEVKISELVVTNKTKDATIKQMKLQFNALREDNDLRQEERLDLEVQLSVANDTNTFEADQHSSLSSFGGMTELNPEVLERVESLEKENAILREQCDSSTVTTIENLKNNLDDMSRIKITFEKRYHESCAENKKLSQSLSVTKQKLVVTENKLNKTISALENRTESLLKTKEKLVDTTSSLEMLTLRFNDQHFNMTNQLLELKEHSSVEFEDLRSTFTEHLSKHTVSDEQYKETITKLEDESNEQTLRHKNETLKLDNDILLLQKSEKKLKSIIVKGRSKLEQRENVISSQTSKIKQGAQVLKKMKKDLEASKNKCATLQQKVIQAKNENALLRESGCSDMESGNSKSSRSASKLNRELDRVISENEKLQKELNSAKKQVLEYQQQQLSSEESPFITGRAGKRSKRLSSKKTDINNSSTDASTLLHLENENQRLQKENKTLSMMKTVYTREQHQSELKEQKLEREKKKLEEIITHLRLKMEREPLDEHQVYQTEARQKKEVKQNGLENDEDGEKENNFRAAAQKRTREKKEEPNGCPTQ
jgi:hypothetical protein